MKSNPFPPMGDALLKLPPSPARPSAQAMHPGGRPDQQDACCLLHHLPSGNCLVLVCDGVGGSRSGGLASRTVIESGEELWNLRQGVLSDPKGDLLRLAKVAHDRIMDLAWEGEKHPPASTLVALYVNGSSAHWIHSGDSRLYRFRDGGLLGRTRDHSVVQILVDQGEVDEKNMGSHPDQGRLLQSLGVSDCREPVYGSAELDPADAFFLCTDGFWERTPVERIAAVLASPIPTLQRSLEHAVQLAVQANGPNGDNVTAIALAYSPAWPGRSPASPAKRPLASPLLIFGFLALLPLGGWGYWRFTAHSRKAGHLAPIQGEPAQIPAADKTVKSAGEITKPDGVFDQSVKEEEHGKIYPDSPENGKIWTNQFGMIFRPVVTNETTTLWFLETEVTNKQWRKGSGIVEAKNPNDDTLPKSNISFEDAIGWAAKLTGTLTDLPKVAEMEWEYRLPTISEWIGAAIDESENKDGDQGHVDYIWGSRKQDEVSKIGNIDKRAALPVRSMEKSNRHKLWDMCGNLEEFAYSSLPSSSIPPEDFYTVGWSFESCSSGNSKLENTGLSLNEAATCELTRNNGVYHWGRTENKDLKDPKRDLARPRIGFRIVLAKRK